MKAHAELQQPIGDRSEAARAGTRGQQPQATGGLASWVQNSPRMLAQRRQLTQLFGGTIQRMVKSGHEEETDGHNYVIDTRNRSVLFVKPNEALPIPGGTFVPAGQELARDNPKSVKKEEGGDSEPPVKYIGYRFNGQLGSDSTPNDCGMYAAALASGNSRWTKETRGGQHLEGMRPVSQYDANVGADEDSKENKLSMQPGNMYHIDWDDMAKQRIDPECFRHAATVVAVDGADHVTSEVDASQKALTLPQFRMYGTERDTFYEAHRGSFEGPGETGWNEGKGRALVTKYVKTA